MKDSTRRALRTAFQVLLGVLTAIPAIATSLPSWAIMAQVIVVTGALSKAINALEELGVVPAWLKGSAQPVSGEGDAAP